MATSLTEIFDRNGVRYQQGGSHHHVRSGWVGVDCPKCSPNAGRFRLGFEINGRRANCWVCGKVNAVEMLQLLCRTTARDAARMWNSRELKSRLPQTEELPRDRRLVEPLGLEDPLPPPHRRYLQKRGFVPEHIERLWGVKGIGMASSRLAWRLYIPIYDKWGRQVSWTTRSISPEAERRYISAAEEDELVSHKTVLYGAHLCRSAVVVVEGPISAWAVGPGAVATCGVGCTAQQVAAAAEYPLRVICFDAEPAAQRRAEQVCNQLSVLPGITENVVLETGKDAADADPAELSELRDRYLE